MELPDSQLANVSTSRQLVNGGSSRSMVVRRWHKSFKSLNTRSVIHVERKPVAPLASQIGSLTSSALQQKSFLLDACDH
jgi:hypothetical protein